MEELDLDVSLDLSLVLLMLVRPDCHSGVLKLQNCQFLESEYPQERIKEDAPQHAQCALK